MTKHLQLLTALAVILLVGFPVTGGAATDFRARRSAAILEDTNLDDIKAEINFGRDVAARILGNMELNKDEELTRYLNRIGKGIAVNAGRPELAFHFAVLDSETVNAFAAPGGYVFVTTGALRLMADEAELAAVLGHEIGHVSAKHIVKELKIRGEDREGKSLTSLIGGTTDPIRVALQQMVDQAVKILFERGYQKQDEFESDRIGSSLLALSGYDPTALQRYLLRIDAAKGTTTADIHRTHPPNSERSGAISVFLNENGLSSNDSAAINQERFKHYVQLK